MWSYLAVSLGWSALGFVAGAAVTDAGWSIRHNLHRRQDDNP